jgi:hypothetical protein
MTRNPVGVYFLADDHVYDWAVGLLHSLRAAAPAVRVYCVPFSERVEHIGRLEARFDFRMIQDPSLAELDEIGRELFARMSPPPPARLAGTFRKFYTFWGPLERFLYTDADVVVLDGFERLFESAVTGDHALTYAHADIGQVYRPGRLRERMVRDHAAPGINTGLWASRAGLFDLDRVRRLAAEAGPVAPEFCSTLEQPFLNYCLDVAGVAPRPFGPEAACAWAGDHRPFRFERLAGGRLRGTWSGDGSIIHAIHWSGSSLSDRMPHHHVFQHFRTGGGLWGERFRMYRRRLSAAWAGRAWRWLKRVGPVK